MKPFRLKTGFIGESLSCLPAYLDEPFAVDSLTSDEHFRCRLACTEGCKDNLRLMSSVVERGFLSCVCLVELCWTGYLF